MEGKNDQKARSHRTICAPLSWLPCPWLPSSALQQGVLSSSFERLRAWPNCDGRKPPGISSRSELESGKVLQSPQHIEVVPSVIGDLSRSAFRRNLRCLSRPPETVRRR